jgi:energy-coupling factor transporter ATP-binding protein EcfA2
MKKAAIDKAWSDCRNPTKKRLDVTSILLKRGDTIQEISISSRINALLGENGAGKSTLISTLAHIGSLKRVNTSFYSGTSISLRFNNKCITLPPPQPLEGEDAVNSSLPTFESVNLSRDAHITLDFLAKQQNLPEYLVQFEHKILTQKELQEVNSITGRNYSEIKFKEFESPIDPDEYLPYFSVKLANSTEYDSLGMGLGELCTFLVIWRLSRCKNGQAILLDEPDSHLSPNARRRLADFLAVKAAEKELWVIFSTHSIESIENMSEAELLLLARPDEAQTNPVNIGKDKNEAFLRLGLTLSKRFLLLVEDLDSQELLSQILQKFQPLIAQTCEVIALIKGGEEIVKTISGFPTDNTICRVIAVLDGDKSKTITPSNDLLFLPSDSDPIAAAKEWALKNMGVLATKLNLADQLVSDAISRSSHVDHHDYCAEVAQRLALPGIHTKDIRRALLNAWLSDRSVATDCEEFSKNLLTKLDISAYRK